MINQSSLNKRKEMISPKITSTKTTIIQKTPFYIKKHHLDDSQMKRALRYDSELLANKIPRSYSYKGQFRTCMNSKIGQSNRTIQADQKQSSNKQKQSQYYQQITHRPQIINKKQQRQMKTCTTQRNINQQQHNYYNDVQKYNQKNRNINKYQKPQNYSVMKIYQNPVFEIKIDSMRDTAPKQYNQYRLRQPKSSKNQIKKKQLQKLQKKYEKKLKKNLQIQQKKMIFLEEQLDELRIKNMQLERKKLKDVIQQAGQKTDKIIDKQLKTIISMLIANKQKYRIKHKDNSDTDSSFSSFQMN